MATLPVGDTDFSVISGEKPQFFFGSSRNLVASGKNALDFVFCWDAKYQRSLP
jgi:hypothetical protein